MCLPRVILNESHTPAVYTAYICREQVIPMYTRIANNMLHTSRVYVKASM